MFLLRRRRGARSWVLPAVFPTRKRLEVITLDTFPLRGAPARPEANRATSERNCIRPSRGLTTRRGQVLKGAMVTLTGQFLQQTAHDYPLFVANFDPLALWIINFSSQVSSCPPLSTRVSRTKAAPLAACALGASVQTQQAARAYCHIALLFHLQHRHLLVGVSVSNFPCNMRSAAPDMIHSVFSIAFTMHRFVTRLL